MMSELKLLIIGANKKHSLERVYLKNLEELNINVSLFDVRSILDKYRETLFNKVLLKIGNQAIYDRTGEQLLKFIEEYKPNVVLVFKGMEINKKTLLMIKKRGVYLINYNPDHPFIFSSTGSGNKNVLNTGKFYDLHITYGKNIAEQIEERLKVPCEILPFGFDLNEEDFSKIENIEEINRVCFIGHPDKDRKSKIEFLAKNNIPITVYGKNWSNHITSHPNLEVISEPLYGINYWRELRRYRVQLNLFRKHNINSHNMRSFEIPAAGSIMLSASHSDHKKYFDKNDSFFEYSSSQDLLNKCSLLLNMNKEDSDIIRSKARELSLNNDYSYFSRSKHLLKIIEENLRVK